MRFRALFIACTWLSITNPANAQLTKTMPYQTGDSWTYKIYSSGQLHSHATFSVGPIAGDGNLLYMIYDAVPKTPPQTPSLHGFFSTTTCVYDFVLRQTLDLADSCSIALEKGKRWRVATEDNANTALKQYIVVGLEEVTVPAGKFTAVRIDFKREQRAKFAEAGPGQPAGKYLDSSASYWFVPSLKTFVKYALIGQDERGGVQFETSYEMTEYRNAQAVAPVRAR